MAAKRTRTKQHGTMHPAKSLQAESEGAPRNVPTMKQTPYVLSVGVVCPHCGHAFTLELRRKGR